MNSKNHIPVLLDEAITSLGIKDFGVYVDATFGAGGYSQEILSRNNTVKVVAFDRDKSVENFALNLKKQYKDRFEFINDKFSNICNHINYFIDGAVFDIGVSSMQIDNADRGFSYNKDGRLDMRMDNSSGITAYDIINTFSENQLADIIYAFGEEQKAKYISKQIVSHRKIKSIITTFDLVEVLSSCVSFSQRSSCIKRVFQALRIYVNDELNELHTALCEISSIIKTGGILSVVTFHSLEDRIVKNFFKPKNNTNRYAIDDISYTTKELFKKIQKKVIIPNDVDIKNNSRSASAKLRYAEKI